MDIRGLGPALIQKFIDKGWLKDVADIYTLKDHRDEMLQMEGLGEKAVDKLLKSIEDSKTQSLDRVIKALGIPGIGRHVGKSLAQYYPQIYSLHNIKASVLRDDFEGIGEVSALAISNFFSSADGWALIVKLGKLGLKMESSYFFDTKSDEKKPLADLTFVITGTLPTLKREEAAMLIEKHGGKVSSSISKKTNYLLCGENAGSKLDKAKTLGVKVLNESEFKNMIN
jgi:DNA ligase (NAD+)